ncbi:hypothetical protein CMQ_1599 [Grosmannia clavigera kw1407]|uniref:Uncharacterized protein n=1 Tax=Grosmannia clavigera (strain kw1407 / UAMH 11150) TaxID=655863 RepID=F0XCF3_GROCL|nr:uncharacterized protein CMQ_1599 [Grosmannia clavigera kw1407]EFX04671.1 hypothetical protein CMQ_1599 [Grosmannia clavigera kw1407]
MYFSTVATIAALVLSKLTAGSPIPFSTAGQDTTTAPLARQAADPHEADFRTFGVSGCLDENQGVYTLEKSSDGECLPFVDPIGSLLVADDLCTLTLYSDAECTESPVVAPVGVCQNGTWQSYTLTC